MLSFSFNATELNNTLKRYVEANKRDAAECVDRQAAALASGVGFGRTKGLFQEAMAEKDNVQAAIKTVASAGPLRRPKGRSWQQEFDKRLKYAAIIQASGWLSVRYGARKVGTKVRGLRAIANPPGRVIAILAGSEPFVQITNTQPRALEFAMATGYIDRAVENRIQDMLAYINRKTAERAKEF